VAAGVALDVDGDWQPRDMRRLRGCMYRERGGHAAKPHRADPACVDAGERLALDGGDVLSVGRFSQRSQKLAFGEQRAGFHRAADADADHDGRACGSARILDRGQNVAQDSFDSCGGWKHEKTAHVLAAEAFRRDGEQNAISAHEANMQHGRRVVSRVDAREGIENGFA